MPRAQLAEDQQLLDVNDVASWWRVPKSFVYSVTADGRLEAIKIGRYLRYTRASVERFMKTTGRG